MFPKFELIAIMMNFMMLPKARRPSVTPRSSTPRSRRSKMMSAASLATSTALSTEIPTSAECSDGASLIPSPRKPTTWPRWPQPENDALFLSWGDPAEQVCLLQPRGERFVAKRFDLGAGQHPGDRNAEFAAHML